MAGETGAEIVAFPPRDPASAVARVERATVSYLTEASGLVTLLGEGLTTARQDGLPLMERRAAAEMALDALALLTRMAGPRTITPDAGVDRSLRALVAASLIPLAPAVLDALRVTLAEDA